MKNPRPKILLVEDDQELLEALEATIDLLGFDSHATRSVKGAMSALSVLSFDLLLTDYNIGDEIADQIIHHWKSHSDRPVAVYTGNDTDLIAARLGVRVFGKPDIVSVIEFLQDELGFSG